MRVTNNMMVNNLMSDMSRNLSRMEQLERNLATGKKFTMPSDDPIGVSRSLRLNTDVSVMDQYKRNVEDSQSWLETTEIAVGNISEVLKRAKELVVQATNETYSGEQRQAIASEIKQLKEQLISIGNTNYAGSYIFSGFKTDKPLLAGDGSYDIGGGTNKLTLDEVIEVNVGIGDKIGFNAVGQRLFGYCPASFDDNDLDMITSDTLMQKQTMTGNYLDLAADPTAAGNFVLTYGGADTAISLTAGYSDLTSLRDAINTAIGLTGLI
jgi:flagellar hook-associated protein 3 FlgL